MQTQSELFTTDHNNAPLAERLRPQHLGEVIGQDHLLQADGLLQRMIASGKAASIILWGPPGTGKTTLAHIISQALNYRFYHLSAIFSNVKELREVFKSAEDAAKMGENTILFVDEIHRFNKAQLDSFLPHVEAGTITLIGATTENPSFHLNAALLSRCTVLTLNKLDTAALEQLLDKAAQAFDPALEFTDGAKQNLLQLASGDGRYLLNMVEQLALDFNAGQPIDHAAIEARVHQRSPNYDKDGDGHYNLISALHKSLRGSDPQAGLYYLARMLNAGEEPLYISRRLVRFAVEDIGLADPQAVVQANHCQQVFQTLGTPEGELALAQLVVYLALAPKSNAVYSAYKAVRKFAKENGDFPPPKHILNAPTNLMKDEGYGDGYLYDHDQPDSFSGQDYFPTELKERPVFYTPKPYGFERDMQKRIEYFNKLREKRRNG